MVFGFLVLVNENDGDVKGRHRLGEGSDVRRREERAYEFSAERTSWMAMDTLSQHHGISTEAAFMKHKVWRCTLLSLLPTLSRLSFQQPYEIDVVVIPVL